MAMKLTNGCVGLATMYSWWYTPRMTIARLITFTAGQASHVTGLTPVMQRDWRRRGYLAAVEGRAEFNPFDLADLRTMKLLSDGGVGPASSRLWKRAVAYCVVSRALMSLDAYKGTVPSELTARDHIRRALLREYASEPSVYTGEFLPAGAHQLILQAPRFAVWWGEDSASMGDSLDELHAKRSRPGMPTAPGIFLDVHGAADDLLREAGPLVHCEE